MVGPVGIYATCISPSWAKRELGSQHYVQGFLASLHSFDLLVNESSNPRYRRRTHPADVGRDENVFEREERVAVRERFGIRHVKSEAKSPALGFGEQRRSVSDGAARDVDEEAAVGHPGQKVGVDEMMRVLIEWHRDHHDVGEREKFE